MSLLVPKCLSLPFLLLYFTLLPYPLTRSRSPSSSSMTNYFSKHLQSLQPCAASAFWELALGSSEITSGFSNLNLFPRYMVDILLAAWSCLFLMQLGQSLLHLLTKLGTHLHPQQQFFLVHSASSLTLNRVP